MSKTDVLPYLENAYSFLMDPAIGVALKEIKHLRQQNAELLEALKTLHIWSIRSTGHFGCDPFFDCGGDENCTCGKTHALNGAADAIAKATEGEK